MSRFPVSCNPVDKKIRLPENQDQFVISHKVVMIISLLFATPAPYIPSLALCCLVVLTAEHMTVLTTSKAAASLWARYTVSLWSV